MQGTIAIMVMRSSLDPLEEARARIRLRHARAKPVKPIAKTIGTLSQRITRDRLPVRFQLQMHKFIWPPDEKGV